MKTRFLVLLILVVTSLAFSQSSRLFDNYKIPSYSYNSLTITGWDFLTYVKYKVNDGNIDNDRFNLSFDLKDQFVKQTPMYSGTASARLYYNYDVSNSFQKLYSGNMPINIEQKDEYSETQFYGTLQNDFYISNPKGFFIYGNLNGYYTNSTPSKRSQSIIELQPGVGYGRIVKLKPVVQAYILGKEIGSDLSDMEIEKLTEKIEMYNNGYYTGRYKDNSEIEFYKDITEVTKKPEQVTKIQQVVNSALYPTAERMSGWCLRGGAVVTERGGQLENYGDSKHLSDLNVKAEYALPWGFDKQLYLSAGYSKNLDNEKGRAPKASVLGRFSIDHNYTWSSTLNLYYDSIFPSNEGDKSNIGIDLTTRLVILNSLAVTGSVIYQKVKYNDLDFMEGRPFYSNSLKTERTAIHLGLTYYIL